MPFTPLSQEIAGHIEGSWWLIHRENGDTLGMVPLIINPIYTLYSEHLLGISVYPLLKGLLNS